MQHLDEGTIHSWLDGALSADEAARVEAHVAECPQCAAAVAEARGFIAASSRILTALDDVPRAVVPAAAPVKWHNRAAWRAAAAVLVVAVGSLVVLKNGGNEPADRRQSMPDSMSARTTPQLAAPIIRQGNSSGEIAIDKSLPSAATSEKFTEKAAAPDKLPVAAQASGAPRPRVAYSGTARSPVPQANVPALENRTATAQVNGAVAENRSTSSGYAGAAVATPQSSVPTRVIGVATMDAAREQMSLKKVRTQTLLGAKVTLYEVAPGDTVTFTEPMNIQLNAVGVTGVATAAPMARRSTGKSAVAAQRNDAAASSAADSPSPAKEVGAPTAPQSAATPPSRVEVVNGITTITWLDPNTGKMLKLSGRIPVQRLEEIKTQIQRERAAAAAKQIP